MSSQLIQYCCTVLLCRARKLRAMNSAIIANMCIRTCIYGCTQICMPTGAYIATKRDFAYVSVPYHAVTACKFSYGSVTVCGYFAVLYLIIISVLRYPMAHRISGPRALRSIEGIYIWGRAGYWIFAGSKFQAHFRGRLVRKLDHAQNFPHTLVVFLSYLFEKVQNFKLFTGIQGTGGSFLLVAVSRAATVVKINYCLTV